MGLATRLSLRHLTLGDRVQRLVGAVTVNLPARPDCRRTFGEQPHEASPTKCWVSWNGEVLYRRRAERTKTNNTVTLIVFVAPSPMSGTRLRPSIRLCLSLLPVVSYRVRVVLRSTHHRLLRTLVDRPARRGPRRPRVGVCLAWPGRAGKSPAAKLHTDGRAAGPRWALRASVGRSDGTRTGHVRNNQGPLSLFLVRQRLPPSARPQSSGAAAACTRGQVRVAMAVIGQVVGQKTAVSFRLWRSQGDARATEVDGTPCSRHCLSPRAAAERRGWLALCVVRRSLFRCRVEAARSPHCKILRGRSQEIWLRCVCVGGLFPL